MLGRWVRAEAAAVLAALLDRGLRKTFEAAEAARLLVTSLFRAMLCSPVASLRVPTSLDSLADGLVTSRGLGGPIRRPLVGDTIRPLVSTANIQNVCETINRRLFVLATIDLSILTSHHMMLMSASGDVKWQM